MLCGPGLPRSNWAAQDDLQLAEIFLPHPQGLGLYVHISIPISIATLNTNSLNITLKLHSLSECIQTKTQLYAIYKKSLQEVRGCSLCWDSRTAPLSGHYSGYCPCPFPNPSLPQQQTEGKSPVARLLHHLPQLHQRTLEAQPPPVLIGRRLPTASQQARPPWPGHTTTSPSRIRGHQEAQAPPAPTGERINACTYNHPKPRWAEGSVRTRSTTQRATWQHQNLVVLQQQDQNFPRQAKQKKTTFKITL